jgi:hypothetical protein
MDLPPKDLGPRANLLNLENAASNCIRKITGLKSLKILR